MKQITFSGQLSQDVTPKFISEGDYVDAFNIIIHTSKAGQSGLLKKYPGFDKIEAVVPEGSVVLNAVTDKVNSAVFYFLHSPEGDSIWRFKGNSTEKIIEWDFNFSAQFPVLAAGIIGDMLFFTDFNNPPRKVNIKKVYTDIQKEDVSLAKRAPIFPLRAFKQEELVNFSTLTGKAFMFSYRYVYEDNETSVLAPYTPIIYCPESGIPVVKIYLYKNDYESVPNNIKKIEILARENTNDYWRIFRSLTKEKFEEFITVGGIDYPTAIEFTGLKGRAISLGESAKPFENIPLKSKCLEIARDRVFLANNVEGYDLYEVPSFRIDVEDANVTPDPEHLQVFRVERDKSDDWTINPADPQVQRTVWNNYYVRKGSTFYFLASGTTTHYLNGFETGSTPGDYTGSEEELTIGEDDFKTYGEVFFNNTFSVTQYDRSYAYPVDHFIYLTLEAIFSVGETKFKNRSQYQAGIVFYDNELRNSGVYTNDNSIVTINDDFRNSQLKYMKWSVGEDPIPEWAVAYQIVRTDNLSRVTFIQGRTSDIYWVYGEKVSRQLRNDAEFIEIDISGSIKAGVRYSFTEGDLIDIDNGTKVVTAVIRSVVGAKIRIDVIDIPNLNFQSPARYYYEIWRPRESVSVDENLNGDIFYEVSEVFPIISPGTPERSFGITSGYLKGDVVVINEDTYDYADSRTINSEGQFENNELEPTPNQITIEAINIDNDINVGWIKDLGRPNAVLDVGQAYKPNSIRFSNKYIQGTSVNGTSNFDFGDEEQVPVESGEINSLTLVDKQQADGNVMLAICNQEALSIYLGETQFVDTEGREVVGSSSKVIGTINALAGGYGTQHPLSVRTHKGRAWWWDAHSKKVVRYDPNGVRPISDINNKSFFYGRSGSPMTAYDPFHSMFFIGFSGNSIAFHEGLNQWRGFYGFIPEASTIVNEFVILFKDGVPYRSNSNSFKYFGEEYVSHIDFFCVYPTPELLDNIAIYLTQNSFVWEGGRQKLLDVFDISVTNEEGQWTNLIPSDFEVNESVARAQFYRDINSPGGLRNGYEMRSDIHRFRLTLKNGGVELININSKPSSGHL